MPTLERQEIRETGFESGRISEAVGQGRHITIIEAGWGSSGYYPREVLARDGPTVWGVGTHMYMNHPTESEDFERPERTVQELAAVITSIPVMVGNELVAEAKVFKHWQPMIDEAAEFIGTSIRAMAAFHEGEAEGRNGPIIDELIEGISVDFVTKAGAGGKVGDVKEAAKIGLMFESAREATGKVGEARNAANWLEARIHGDFTYTADRLFGEGYLSRDERVGLSGAIGEALKAFNSYVHENLPQLESRDPYSDPDGEETQVDESAADPPTATIKGEGHMR